MDTIQLLKKFAGVHGIQSNKVDEFLAKYMKPKTIRDVMALPHDMQKHIDYITWVGEPLKSFISDEIYDGNRYETLELEQVVDRLYDRIYDLFDDDDDDLDLDEVDILTLTIDDEKKQAKLDEYKEIIEYIIDTKFGSVVLDW